MKNISLSVEFKNPEDELQRELQRNGARNIRIRRNYDGSIEVTYTIACRNPQKDIENLLTRAGCQNVRGMQSYNGARFEFKIDDKLDERNFKRELSDILRRAGYRAN